MKYLFLLPFLSLTLFLNAQKYLDLQTAFNYPINYTSNDLLRKIGCEIGIIAGKNINDKIGIETGLNTYCFGRRNMKYYATITNQLTGEENIVQQNFDFLKLEANIPLLVKYNLDKSNISIKSGFLLMGHNLLYFTFKGGHGLDFYPEEYRKAINLGFNLNFMFQISDRTRTYLDYKTSLKFKNLQYGLIAMGFNFNIANR